MIRTIAIALTSVEIGFALLACLLFMWAVFFSRLQNASEVWGQIIGKMLLRPFFILFPFTIGAWITNWWINQ
jgi:hypothetical protein